MFLHQCAQALVEVIEMGVADKQRDQQHQAGATNPQGGAPMPAPTAVQTHPQQHRQARRDNRRFRPEAFRQGQTERGAGSPARQQIGHGPTRCGNDAHSGKAREGHVAHAGDHGQHGTQWADEAPDQQAGDSVLVEVGFCAVHPFRMLAQAGQAPDVLMEMAAQVIGNAVAQ